MQQSVHNRQDSRSPCTETHITEEAAGPTGEKHCRVGGRVFNQVPGEKEHSRKEAGKSQSSYRLLKSAVEPYWKHVTGHWVPSEGVWRFSPCVLRAMFQPLGSANLFCICTRVYSPRSFSFSSQLTIESQHNFIFISNLFNKEKYSSELPGKLHFSSFLPVQSDICVSRNAKPKPIHYKGREATCNPGLQHIIVFFFPIKSFYLKQ